MSETTQETAAPGNGADNTNIFSEEVTQPVTVQEDAAVPAIPAEAVEVKTVVPELPVTAKAIDQTIFLIQKSNVDVNNVLDIYSTKAINRLVEAREFLVNRAKTVK